MMNVDKKNKLGIITYHAADNYGSVLQVYALSHYLSEVFSVDCNIINYSSKSQRRMYELYFANDSIKTVLKNIYIFFVLRRRKLNKIRRFLEFRTENFKMYPANPTCDIEKLDVNMYDWIVCGSDQIWNVRVDDYNPIYMLKGINGPYKLSYAASMGGVDLKLSKMESHEIYECLKEYMGISVRENIAKKMLSECAVDNVRNDIDPTFLLSEDHWKNVMTPRVIEGEYIFFYSVDYNEESVKIAEWYGKNLNLPVIYVNTSWQSYFIKKGRMKCFKNAGIEEFLSLVYYAKAVLSGSFHGTAFSLIFNKPFYRIQRNQNNSAVVDDRIRTLFDILEIRGREISTENYKEKINGLFDMEYQTINENIKIAQNKAREYFSSILLEEVKNENRKN